MPNTKLDIPEATTERPHTAYEKQILRNREYRAKNKEKTNKYRAKYYQQNKEQIKEVSRVYMKKYYEDNPHKRIEHNDYMTAQRHGDNDKTTGECETEDKEAIRQTKKNLRAMMKQVAYANAVIQNQAILQAEIAEAEATLNQYKSCGKILSV